jgi:ESS family glutamate:Na+ symporter
LLPRAYWFELGLINYGFSTAATAQGLMFLRMVDPRMRSGAAETYALAAPLTAPFVGGGVITFAVLPPLLSTVGALPVAAVVVAMVVVLAALAARLAGADSPAADAQSFKARGLPVEVRSQDSCDG